MTKKIELLIKIFAYPFKIGKIYETEQLYVKITGFKIIDIDTLSIDWMSKEWYKIPVKHIDFITRIV